MTNTALNSSVFSFNSNPVNTITDDHGEPWFLANDVCAILGYKNPRDAINKHCREKGVAKRDTLTEGGSQEMTFINEGNLYRLIIKSRKPEAEAFETLVMDEILPAIRKTGKYEAKKTKPQKGITKRYTPTTSLTPEHPSLNIDAIRKILYAMAQELRNSLHSVTRTRQYCGFFMPVFPDLVGRVTDTTAHKGKEVRHLCMVSNLPTISWGCIETAPRVTKLAQENRYA